MYMKSIGRYLNAEEDDDHPFSPVKGILLAFALGIVLWAGIIGAAVYAFMA
jgi:hypothetical protein